MPTFGSPPLDPLPPELDHLWKQALADAGFSSGDVELIVFDADPSAQEPRWAMYLEPPKGLHDLDRFFTGAERDAVDRLNLYRHRVALWVGDPRLPTALILALMRHELRHAQQVAANEMIYHIALMTNESLAQAYGHCGAGATSIFRLAPFEADADAVATALVGTTGGDADIRNGEFRGLVRSQEPIRPLDELGRRTLAFAALHPEAFITEATRRHSDAERLLEDLDPDGPALFETLRANGELARLRASVTEAIPTQGEIDAADNEPAQAWKPLRKKLAAALRRAEELLSAERR